MYFWGGYTTGLLRHVLQKGGWDTCVGRFITIQLNIRILIENPLGSKGSQKKGQKVISVNFLQWENALNYF